jgi:hypothetical protein
MLLQQEKPSLDLPKIRKNPFVEIIPINLGCLGSCTYCKTVHARGALTSYAPEEILARVRQVIADGVREIRLTRLQDMRGKKREKIHVDILPVRTLVRFLLCGFQRREHFADKKKVLTVWTLARTLWSC